MRQLLSDQLDWSAYYSHNTGDEHANRISGHELDINYLRERSGLKAKDDLSAFDYALDHDGYVFVTDNKGILRAYILARNNREEGTYIIDDLTVDPEYRNRGLGKFVLGKLASKMQLAMNNKTMFGAQRIAMGQHLVDHAPDLASWLDSRGFSQTDELPTPTMLLPGQMVSGVPADHLAEAKEPMPENWNGSLGVYDSDNNDSWSEVFRNGNPVGTIALSRDEKIKSTEDEFGFQIWHRYNFEFTSGLRETGIFTNELFATIAMLNHTTART